MAMTTVKFLQAFQQIKAFTAESGELPADFRAGWEHMQKAFRRAYTPEDFKAALAARHQIPDALEEHATSLLILLRREMARQANPEEDL